MRGTARKHDDEMLVVHRPHQAVPPGADGALARLAASLPADVGALAGRLRRAEAGERSQLVAAIQVRFGNQFAGRVVGAVRDSTAAPGGGADDAQEDPQ